MRLAQHSERATYLESGFGNAAHHFENLFELGTILYFPPGGSHAHPLDSVFFRIARGLNDVIHIEQAFVIDICFVVCALWAVGAVFRASAGLDRNQLAELDVPGFVILAVYLLGLANEIQQRLLVDGCDLWA